MYPSLSEFQWVIGGASQLSSSSVEVFESTSRFLGGEFGAKRKDIMDVRNLNTKTKELYQFIIVLTDWLRIPKGKTTFWKQV